MKYIRFFAGIVRDVVLYSLLPFAAAFSLLYLIFRITGIESVLWVEGVTTDIFSLVAVLAWFWFYKEESIRSLFEEKITFKRMLLLIPGSILIRVAVVLTFILLAFFPKDIATALVESLNRAVDMQWESFEEISAFGSAMLFISFVILGPIGEELFYRGIIYKKLLSQFPPATSIVLSAIVFALAHVHPGLYLSTFIIGIALAWVFYKWNNLAYAIVLHMLINLHPFIIELFVK